MIHHTRVADAAVLAWAPIDDDWEVSVPAVVDTAHTLPSGKPFLARLDYDELEDVAKREGGLMLSHEQDQQIRKLAREGKAVQLVPFLGTPRAENGIEHSQRHDENVWKQLDAIPWTLESGLPVSDPGKGWRRGAPPGRSRIEGWDKDGPGPGTALWQEDAIAHNREHFDDGTTGQIVRRRRKSFLSMLANAVKRAIAAAFERPVPSHGYRCSVAELVADAVALGTWRPASSGYKPKRGDLVISARSGEDPTTGGRGHVERALEDLLDGAHELITIGGNENNTWIVAPYDLRSKDFRGCIEVDRRIGEKAIAFAQAELDAGVREFPGAKHHPRILMYHKGARRKGTRLAGMPGHEGEGFATLLGMATDEIPWCASSASWCTFQAIAA